tara:strand:+ start:29 stop:241 length:213 start_codon:yes stop_codon:yes gene_type:complete
MKIGDLVKYKVDSPTSVSDAKHKARKGIGLIVEVLQDDDRTRVLRVQWNGIIQVSIIEMEADLVLVAANG